MISANIPNLIATAAREVGTAESPPRSNRQKYGAWYGLNGQPWCAIWVSWVFWHAGHPLPRIASPKGFAYVPDIVSWAKRDKSWDIRPPRPGDIVIYKFGPIRPNHVGIVETVHPDGSITAIEGNTDGSGSRTGGRVMRQRRRSNIHGYVAVRDVTPVPIPSITPPAFPIIHPEDEEDMKPQLHKTPDGQHWITLGIHRKRITAASAWTTAVLHKIQLITLDSAATAYYFDTTSEVR